MTGMDDKCDSHRRNIFQYFNDELINGWWILPSWVGGLNYDVVIDRNVAFCSFKALY